MEITCVYCGESECELRVASHPYWLPEPTEWICRECFTPTDTGPCWDDLDEE